MEINDNSCEKNMKLPISVIILTYNEEKNIEDCLKSVYGWVEEIFIVDSFSTDKTLEIARKYTNKIYQHPFENHAKQFNWALENLPLKGKWIMRLDADEHILPELRGELIAKLSGFGDEVSGLYFKRRVYCLGKWIRHGGYYPTWLLRIWRNGKARCEERWMDEHIKIEEGKTLFLKNDIVDDNKKNLHWWTSKHNNYATREAIDILNLKYDFFNGDNVPSRVLGTQEKRKRWLKENFYSKMPLFFRPFLYFLYRYFLKLGFLDGKEGLIFHFLQGFWYRFLVDAKIYEIEKKAKEENKLVKQVIEEMYGIKL
ncbi:MAG: glycosyltransferase family 2 protein [Verrucomicrobiia bacterium]